MYKHKVTTKINQPRRNYVKVKGKKTHQFHILSNLWHDSWLLLASKNACADETSSLLINVVNTDSSKLFSIIVSSAEESTFRLTENLGLSALILFKIESSSLNCSTYYKLIIKTEDKKYQRDKDNLLANCFD